MDNGTRHRNLHAVRFHDFAVIVPLGSYQEADLNCSKRNSFRSGIRAIWSSGLVRPLLVFSHADK